MSQRHGVAAVARVMDLADGALLVDASGGGETHRMENIPTIHSMISSIALHQSRFLCFLSKRSRRPLRPSDHAIASGRKAGRSHSQPLQLCWEWTYVCFFRDFSCFTRQYRVPVAHTRHLLTFYSSCINTLVAIYLTNPTTHLVQTDHPATIMPVDTRSYTATAKMLEKALNDFKGFVSKTFMTFTLIRSLSSR